MDPKPRPRLTTNEQFPHPSYIAAAAKNYFGPPHQYSRETSFTRGDAALEVLDEILPNIPKPNILVVGLGYDSDVVRCSYEHYKIAAHVEAAGKDYSMTLVDVDEGVIEDVKRRKRIFIESNHATRLYWDEEARLSKSWGMYLSDTGQQHSVTFKPMEGLHFTDDYNDGLGLIQGIAYANIPPVFERKLQDDEVTFLNTDIATAPINETGPFDFVNIMNVIYLLSPEGQQLTIANIVRSMKVGGFLMLNDLYLLGNPLLEDGDEDGWLDDKMIGDLGLKMERELHRDGRSRTVLFQRIR